MAGQDFDTPSDSRVLVREFERVIASTPVLEERLSLIARRVAEAVDAWECDLYEYSAETDTLTGTGFWALEITQADIDWMGTVFDLSDRPMYRAMLIDRQVHEDHVDDPGLPPYERDLMEQWDEKTALTVPLVFEDEVVGCLLLLEKREVRRFTAEEKSLVAELAVPAAIAVRNVRLYHEQEERTRRLAALLEASRTIASTVVVEDVLDLVAEKAAQALGSPECMIYEYDPEADALVSRTMYQRPGSSPAGFAEAMGTAYPLADYPTDREVLTSGGILIERADDPALP